MNMKKLYELRDKLCEELEAYYERELTSSTLDTIDKLTHTIKNLDKIIDRCEESEYSNTYGGSYRMPYGYSGRNYYDYRGGVARRDGAGRFDGGYSRSNDMINELTELMESAPDERTRMELHKFIQKMQNM